MKSSLLTLLLLFGGYLLFAQPANDSQANAFDISNAGSWTSTDAAYTNVGATADGTAGTCIGTVRNVWFKFQATTDEMEIKVEIGGAKGTLANPNLTLYNDSGTPLQCKYFEVTTGTAYIQNTSLTSGLWYYISVDQYPTKSPGTFTLSTNNSIGFDLQEKAVVITGNNWSGGDAGYTNFGATADGTPATCVGTVRNVWFKFQATTSEIEIKVSTGGSKGTLTAPHISLYNASGTPLQCKYSGVTTLVHIQTTALTVGAWYYISVDQYPSGNPGTFTINTTNDIGYDLRQKAVTINGNTWSGGDAGYSNVGATADGTAGTCVGTVRNVWFKFQATTNEMEIKVETGGAKGTLSYPNLTLYNGPGTPLQCKYLGMATGTAYIQNTSLTPGSWYYISVDQYPSGNPGTFTITTNNNIGYDLRQKAVPISGNSWSSGDAAYSNAGATADGTAATCVGTARNVWFKFQATTNEMEIKLMTGGSKGTLGSPHLSLYNASGVPLQCKYLGSATMVYIQTTSLTPDSWYYISVDQYPTANAGTFTISTNNLIGFDLREKAKLISSSNWSSSDAAFSNAGATPDGTAGPCVVLLRNVWFKFLAVTSDINISLYTGGAKGTLNYPNLNLYNASGSILQCSYQGTATTINIQHNTLTIGSWYYISVDQYYYGTPGTFSLTVNNDSGPVTPKTFYSIANGQWHDPTTWSLTDGGAPSAVYPEDVDTVYVKGFTVDVSEEVTCTELNIILTTSNTSVRIEGNAADLKVKNAVNIKSNSTLASNNALVVGNNGKIAVGSD